MLKTFNQNKYVELLLRMGIAVAFIYPAVEAFFYPDSWIGFFPSWMLDLPISDTLLLHIFGASEVIIAFWILLGKKIFIPSLAAAMILIMIIAINWKFMDLMFRDLAILVIPVTLAINSYPLEKERIRNIIKFRRNSRKV